MDMQTDSSGLVHGFGLGTIHNETTQVKLNLALQRKNLELPSVLANVRTASFLPGNILQESWYFDQASERLLSSVPLEED